MENLYYGIAVIIICLTGYFISWKYHISNRYTLAILLLVLCGLILRIYTSCDFFLHYWDERFHALVAKNLIKHPLIPTLFDNPVLPADYQNWVGSHIWLHKQPLPLWAMAGSIKFFGINEIAIRLPSIVLSTIGIWLTYKIGSALFSQKTGYIAALLFSVNGLIIEITAGRVATDHIDVFFLFFVELAVFFSILYINRQKTIYNILVGLSIGAAILSKWLPALIVIPVWFILVYDSRKFKFKTIAFQLSVIIFACLLVFMPWQIYIYSVFPREAQWEAGFNIKHITEALEGQTGPFYYFLNQIRINYGELIYLPLIWFIWKSFKGKYDLRRIALLIWFIIPLIFFSLAKTKMQGYLLFSSPALFIITADFWTKLNEFRKNNRYNRLYIIILFLLIALPLRYTVERIKPFEKESRSPLWVKQLNIINNMGIKKGVLFNYDNNIEAMFYTNLTAYNYIPDRKTIMYLMDNQYNVIINDNGGIPDEIKDIKGIIRIDLIKSD